MLKLSLCDYSDVYMLLSGTITVAPQVWNNPNKVNKEVVFKNCTLFIDSTNEISNSQIDNAKDIGVVMPMYNLIEYSDDYLKISGSLWQYYGDEQALTDADAIANFSAAYNSALFNFNNK